jgi:dihydroneopterin aldolase
MGDRILLQGMVFYGYHGVNPQEKELGQSFVVDVELEVDLTVPGRSDDLKDTVDYSQVYQVAKEMVEGASRNLLESVADGLAQELLNRFSPDGVTVRVVKPDTPIRGAVMAGASVEVHRRRRG